MNKPSYEQLEKRIEELETFASRSKSLEYELLKNQTVLRQQNISLVRKSIELADIRKELEDKNYELEQTHEEQKKQNVQLVRKSIELSDIMRRLEDKNYDLEKLQENLENLVKGRTEQLNRINEKLQQEILSRSIAQSDLKESEKRYRTVFENTGAATIIIGNDMTIKMANAKVEELTGYTREEIESGMRWTGFVPDEDVDRMKAYHLLRRKGNTSVPTTYQFTVIDRAGTRKDALIQIGLVPETFESIASIIDITERNRAEKEKQELELQLRQAQKMEAIGTLAGGIAHDFNNILAAIMGYTEMSIKRAADDEKQTRWLERSLKACERAKELVVHILTFSRMAEPELRPVEFNSIVQEALKLLRATIPATIQFHQDIAGEPFTIIADPIQVHQVLMNLCTNAAHAMRKEGGVIGLSLKKRMITAEQAVCFDIEPGNYVELTVEDTGYGIDNETIEKIFDPFFTTKKGEGTGMGLSVVHGIIKNLGGAIAVESSPGRGSRFQVLLPGTDEVIESGNDNGDVLPEGNERILLVDDDSMLIEMTAEMLERIGYHVTAETSSIKAIERFNSQPDMFDLVVTDQTMPHVTGFELAKTFMNIRPGIPVILCSGFSELVTPEEARSMGIADYIMKPYSLKVLAESVRKAIDGE